ncbi:MAG: acyl-CoA thioesterase [Longimicrobiales bacterium]
MRVAEIPIAIPDPSSSPSRTASAPFVVRERVRWSDVDAAGIVCYGMYLRFFELAESELFRMVGLPVRTLSGIHGLWLVRRRIECDFLQPVCLDEELEISVHVAAIGSTSLELGFQVGRVGETVCTASGRYVLVAVDRESLQPLPIPDPIRTALDPYRSR